MVLKKEVLLGFATTTSLILLVMIAPTTTTTATASLQQEGNATTIDEPNIPIGPADEEEEPDEPIPNNETRNDDDDDDNNATDDCDREKLTKAKEKVTEKYMTVGGPVNSVGVGACEIIVTVDTEEDAKNFPISSMDGFPIRVEVGCHWLVGAGGQQQQQQQEQEQSRDPSCPPLTPRFPIPGPGNDTVTECPDIARSSFGTDKKTYNQGEDVNVSGIFSKPGMMKRGTPVQVTYSSPSGQHSGSYDAETTYSDDGCSLSFEFYIENLTEPGTWNVSAMYPPVDGLVFGHTQVQVVAAGAPPPPPGEEPPDVVCQAISIPLFVGTDKAVYYPGDTVKISGGFNDADGIDEDGLVKLEWNNSNPITRATATVVPRHNECGTDFVYTATLGQDVQLNIGNWTVRALWGEGEASTTFEVKSRVDPKQDRDGDGLLDSWERDGIDINQDGQVDLDLPALGADPHHKDVFIEIDYMEHHEPLEKSISDVVSAFANSPPVNPDGTNGVRVHVDVDDQIPHQDFTHWLYDYPLVKSKYFGTSEERSHPNGENTIRAKQDIFHYVVYTHSGDPGTWGCQWEDNCKNIQLSFNEWGDNGSHEKGTQFRQAAALMHELGHTFGLFHGGFEAEKDVNYKPNYLSLMHSGGLYAVPRLDYSRCELPPLDENNLSEPDGIGRSCPEGLMSAYYWPWIFTPTGVPVDWNQDGDFDDTGVIADINDDGKLTILHGHDDWSKLKFAKRSLSSITAITASTASPEQQQNQTIAESIELEFKEFKGPDHSHDDFTNEAREDTQSAAASPH